MLNAGKLRIRGAELEAAWTPIDGLLLDAQVGYLDADYKEFDDVRFPRRKPRLPDPAFAPKWTLRLGAQYGFDLGGSGGITLGGQARYKSRTALAVDNTFIIGTSPAARAERRPKSRACSRRAIGSHDARIV